MLYISIFCIFCRFFCLLTIKNLLSQKKKKKKGQIVLSTKQRVGHLTYEIIYNNNIIIICIYVQYPNKFNRL